VLCQCAPEQARRVIFMTGGAYTPGSADFVAKTANPLLLKPFKPEALEPFKPEALERLLAPLLPPAG
jgi:hypothetical protein